MADLDIAEPDPDQLILDWANKRYRDLTPEQEAIAKGSLSHTAFAIPVDDITSFRDKSLCTSLFFLHLVWAMNPRLVNWTIVKPGKTPEERMLNARYTISVARKSGAGGVFLLPEDICEVKPKMITSFLAALLAVDGFRMV